ncbi:butyrophilin-like protein 8 [Sander lucioperca]|uniref:butyrophilin-like protein 8 n=1 Tax=Sander lucioperca TaxID=283035 RepID=UPI00125E8C60|nr:butyrophilin-like protein 8 [Sander lucioperca]
MAGLTTAPYVAFFISIWIVSPTVADQKEVTVKAGQDVTVDCLVPRDAEILLLKWSRSDLKSDGYIFFVRENRHYESAQHPSYHGRVELRDPQMKAGDVSVVLKNVNVKDTGTYECRVSMRSRETAVEFSHFIKLTITESGHTDGHTVTGEYHILIFMPLSVFVVFVIIICRKYIKKKLINSSIW